MCFMIGHRGGPHVPFYTFYTSILIYVDINIFTKVNVMAVNQ